MAETAHNPSIAELVGSSRYNAIGDDTLKDEDNAAWVLFLPTEVARDWIEPFSWIRLIDRLAESEWIEGWGSRFQVFRIGWRTLLLTGYVLPDDYHFDLLSRMHARWFMPQPAPGAPGRGGALLGGLAPAAGSAPPVGAPAWTTLHAWDEYVEATARYTRSDMVFETLEEYETMLQSLGGSLFQIFPYLTEPQRQAVRAFGAVDQFFNHLRDLPEDTAQNLCYFPADVLYRFGVERQEILDGTCFKNRGYVNMMNFFISDFVPYLYSKAADFLSDNAMHYSWRLLKNWFLRRHVRLARAFRQAGMNYKVASQLYFAEVKPGLKSWLRETFTAEGRLDLLAAGPRPLPQLPPPPPPPSLRSRDAAAGPASIPPGGFRDDPPTGPGSRPPPPPSPNDNIDEVLADLAEAANSAAGTDDTDEMEEPGRALGARAHHSGILILRRRERGLPGPGPAPGLGSSRSPTRPTS